MDATPGAEIVTVVVTELIPLEVNVSVYVVPTIPVKVKLVNVATPEFAATVVVPPRVPPLVLATTFAELFATVLEDAS